MESESKQYREDLKAEEMGEVYGGKKDRYMDCYVYACSECGGEIIINGTEASTTCVYCGNPNVVFSRIAKQKCPEFVMPFSVTKEEAIRRAREQIRKGIFVGTPRHVLGPLLVVLEGGQHGVLVLISGILERGRLDGTAHPLLRIPLHRSRGK